MTTAPEQVHCEFTSEDKRHHRCKHCGRKITTPFPMPSWRVVANCRAPGRVAEPRKPKKPCKGCGDKKPPPAWAQAWDLAKSLAAFAADGMHLVDAAEYRRRLTICDACSDRKGPRCMSCGCYVAIKAQARVWQCPRRLWAGQNQEAGSCPETSPDSSAQSTI